MDVVKESIGVARYAARLWRADPDELLGAAWQGVSRAAARGVRDRGMVRRCGLNAVKSYFTHVSRGGWSGGWARAGRGRPRVVVVGLPLDEDGNPSYSPVEPAVRAATETAVGADRVAGVLALMPWREREAVRLRHGIGCVPLDAGGVGRVFGVSETTARRLIEVGEDMVRKGVTA